MVYTYEYIVPLNRLFSMINTETIWKIIIASICIFGIFIIKRIMAYFHAFISQRQKRKKKLTQVQLTKGKLLQKLVGLKKPMANRDIFTSLTYCDIKERLRRNDLKVIDLLEAYQAKALDVGRTLNCITDVIYDADVTALYLDSLPENKRGSLHGIPLSLKECIKLSDYDCYFGCVSRCFNPETENGCIVEALVSEGMIPFMRTNMSQYARSIACNNPLFGETVNPYDHKRTCGGSSGGEAALIAGGGSLVGIGTDIGGSIRIPASFCGIYGFKPTCERVGHRNDGRCEYSSTSLTYTKTAGPLSSDLDVLVDVMRVIFSPTFFKVDPAVPNLKFDKGVYESKAPMTIGFYKSFSDHSLTIEPVPSVKRAIEAAKAGLERRGHTLVKWEPPMIAHCCDILLRCFLVDGGARNLIVRKKEVFLSSEMKSACFLYSRGTVMKYILAGMTWIVNPLLARLLVRSIPASAAETTSLIKKAEDFKVECYLSWKKRGLDALICPVMPFVAPLTADASDVLIGALYANLYNFLNYPAGTVPVTRVTETDIQTLHASYPQKHSVARKVVKTQAGSVGMPVGVQCVAMKWQDEKALRLMKEVKEAVRK